MSPPRVYGDSGSFQRTLKRHIAKGEALLDEGLGAQNQIDALPPEEVRRLSYLIEEQWEREFRRWFATARRQLVRHLRDQFPGVGPVFAAGLPPDDGKPRHRIGLTNGREWLAKAIEELSELRSSVGDATTAARGASPMTPSRNSAVRGHPSYRIRWWEWMKTPGGSIGLFFAATAVTLVPFGHAAAGWIAGVAAVLVLFVPPVFSGVRRDVVGREWPLLAAMVAAVVAGIVVADFVAIGWGLVVVLVAAIPLMQIQKRR